MGIGVISNPNSRRNRRYPEQMNRLAYLLGEDDQGVTTRSAEDVVDVAKRFRDAEIDILALNGGDGTNHVTLTTFIEVYGDQPLPMVALLRGGTMNTVSNAIGIRGNPSSLLVNIVEKYYLEQPFEVSERDILRITDDRGTRYGFIFGTGLISNFLGMYYDTGKPSPSMAARLLVKAIGSSLARGPMAKALFEPCSAKIEVEGEPWIEGQFPAVLASTIDQIGLGFRPFIRCESEIGRYHALAVRCSPARLVGLLPAIRMGRPLPQEAAADVVAARLALKAARPLEYTVDGDIHRSAGEVTIETGPRLRIIVK